VKSGIWEDGVDAAGGEIQHEEFIPVKPDDALETLSHIAAKKRDVELFKWLDTHSQSCISFHKLISTTVDVLLVYRR
jgi:hypothetical protein